VLTSRRIYSAATESDAEFNLELFAEKWDKQYPSISKAGFGFNDSSLVGFHSGWMAASSLLTLESRWYLCNLGNGKAKSF